MADVTPHALIQSFIAGLSDFLTTFTGPAAAKVMRPLCFESGGAAATFSFKADRDYVFTGVQHPSGYNVAISLSGRASAPLAAGSGRQSDGIFWLTTAATQTPAPQVRVPIPKDSVMTVWIGAAAGAVVVFLQEA